MLEEIIVFLRDKPEFARFEQKEHIDIVNEKQFRGSKVRKDQFFYHCSSQSPGQLRTYTLNELLDIPEYQAYFDGLEQEIQEMIENE